jgi:ATP-dependent protease ClpP protease subunit
MSTNASPLPSEVYGIFSGPIVADSISRIVNGFTTASASNVRHAHIMFHTSGGNVGDGIALYNIFRALPFELTLYNSGVVASIGVIAYLGALHRIVSRSAIFSIHRTQVVYAQGTPARRVQTVVNAALLDDERTEAIFRQHVTMPDELWLQFDHDDLHFSAEESVRYGFAEQIGDFAPPPGTRIYYV